MENFIFLAYKNTSDRNKITQFSIFWASKGDHYQMSLFSLMIPGAIEVN